MTVSLKKIETLAPIICMVIIFGLSLQYSFLQEWSRLNFKNVYKKFLKGVGLLKKMSREYINCVRN